MNTIINQIIKKFEDKPYLLEMGKGSLSKILKCSEEDIINAKKIYRAQYKSQGPNILLIDIETSPSLVWTFPLWNVNIYHEQIEKDWQIMTYSAKWLHDEKMYTGTSYGKIDDYLITKELIGLLDEADIVVAHNLNKFDRKKINSRALFHKITPPSPFRAVDTYEMAKRIFGNSYNKLDYLSKYIGRDGKMENEGFILWKKCMHGDKESWNTMLKYNQKDVLELEAVYLEIRAWDDKHPNVNIYNKDTAPTCTKCNSTQLVYVKDVMTNAKVYKLYRCAECGGYSKERKGVFKSTLMSI